MKIILNSKEVEQLLPEDLPMLIHGKEGSGASLYTLALAVQWLRQGYSVLFLCGYPMAEEQFKKIVGSKNDRVQFFTKEHQKKFKKTFILNTDKKIVFVKNIELFGEDIFDLVSPEQNLVLSGDINASNLKDRILHKHYKTKVYFSIVPGVELPTLNTYEGFMVSDNGSWITKIKP